MTAREVWCLDWDSEQAAEVDMARRGFRLLIDELGLTEFELEWYESFDRFQDGVDAMPVGMTVRYRESKDRFVELSDPDPAEVAWLVEFAPHSMYARAGRRDELPRPVFLDCSPALGFRLPPDEAAPIVGAFADAGIPLRRILSRRERLQRWWRRRRGLTAEPRP